MPVKIIQSLCSHGWAGTFFRTLHKCRVLSVYHAYAVFLAEFGKQRQSPPLNSEHRMPNGTVLKLREIFSRELSNLQYPDGMYDARILEQHMQEGMRIFAALDGARVQAVYGVHPRTAHVPYLDLHQAPLPDKFVYINVGMVAPSLRRQGIGRIMHQFITGTLRHEGFEVALSMIDPDNTTAIRWHRANGFIRWGIIVYMKAGRRNCHWVRRTAVGKRYHDLFGKGL